MPSCYRVHVAEPGRFEARPAAYRRLRVSRAMRSSHSARSSSVAFPCSQFGPIPSRYPASFPGSAPAPTNPPESRQTDLCRAGRSQLPAPPCTHPGARPGSRPGIADGRQQQVPGRARLRRRPSEETAGRPGNRPASPTEESSRRAPISSWRCAAFSLSRTPNGTSRRKDQARSTSNATRLRVSRLNSTATRWIGSPRPRYLSA